MLTTCINQAGAEALCSHYGDTTRPVMRERVQNLILQRVMSYSDQEPIQELKDDVFDLYLLLGLFQEPLPEGEEPAT